jgi:hypothetical protein
LRSDRQIEKEERRRNDEDEAGRHHCFPQLSCQFCQDFGDTWTHLAPAPPGAHAGLGVVASLGGVVMAGNSTGVVVLSSLLDLIRPDSPAYRGNART